MNKVRILFGKARYMRDRHEQFLALRKQFPAFIYEGYRSAYQQDVLRIDYTYRLSEDLVFHSPYEIDLSRHAEKKDEEQIEAFLFSLGLVDLMSYWKCVCSPEIILKCGVLDERQQTWWGKLFYYGLGEFRYQNGIQVSQEDFVRFRCDSDRILPPASVQNYEGIMIPLGGGKDSLVSLEVMRGAEEKSACFILNKGIALGKIIEAADIDPGNILTARRTIDPTLLELNARGYLNGHTPFSALLAFLTPLVAELHGIRSVLLSNESSANEGNVAMASDVNHQYSKTYEFESDVREYLASFVTSSVEYYSLLRPLNELQIAKIFCDLPQYHGTFRSCNRGSKEGKWCCSCPKCLFVSIILAPFLSRKELEVIFPVLPLEQEELEEVLYELIGTKDAKPFECVGTYEEVRAALNVLVRDPDKKDLSLVKKYRELGLEAGRSLQELLAEEHREHVVPRVYLERLVSFLHLGVAEK